MSRANKTKKITKKNKAKDRLQRRGIELYTCGSTWGTLLADELKDLNIHCTLK